MAAQLSLNISVDSVEESSLRIGKVNRIQSIKAHASNRITFQGNFKDRVDINYTTSDDRYKKHSALVIAKPLPSDSGTYTCNVQTFQGKKKKILNAPSILISCLLF